GGRAILARPVTTAVPGTVESEAARTLHPCRGRRPPLRTEGTGAARATRLRLARRDARLKRGRRGPAVREQRQLKQSSTSVPQRMVLWVCHAAGGQRSSILNMPQQCTRLVFSTMHNANDRRAQLRPHVLR